jgi:hypothetical protein
VTCVLVLSNDPQLVDVIKLVKPRYVFLAYRGRELLNRLEEFDVVVCTYLPFDVPPGVKTAGPLTFLDMCLGQPVVVL